MGVTASQMKDTPNLHIKSHNTVHVRLSFKASTYGKGFERNRIHFYFVYKKAEGLGHLLSRSGYIRVYNSSFPADMPSISFPTSPLSSDSVQMHIAVFNKSIKLHYAPAQILF